MSLPPPPHVGTSSLIRMSNCSWLLPWPAQMMSHEYPWQLLPVAFRSMPNGPPGTPAMLKSRVTRWRNTIAVSWSRLSSRSRWQFRMSIAADMNGGRHRNSGGRSAVMNENVDDHGPTPSSCRARSRHWYLVSYSSALDCLHVGLLSAADVSMTEPLAFMSSN